MESGASGLRERGALLMALGLLAMATFLVGAALARLGSVVLGSEAAYGLPVFGAVMAAAGAIAIAFAGRREREPSKFLPRASYGAMASAAATAVAAIALVHMSHTRPGGEEAGAAAAQSPIAWTVLALAVAAPFAVSGATIAGSFRRVDEEIPLLCFVQLAAGALGALTSVLVMRAGAARALLVAALVYSFASLAFAVAAWSQRRGVAMGTATPSEGGWSAPRPGWVATFVVGTAVLIVGDLGASWLKVKLAKQVGGDKTDSVTWTELGLVTADKPSGAAAWIHEDGRKDTPVYDGAMAPPTEPEDLGFVLHEGHGAVLVLDAGGGRAVRAASRAGHTEIDAVVLDPAVAVELSTGDLAEWSRHPYDAPGVRLVVDDARGFVRRRDRAYRVIVLASYRGAEADPLDRPSFEARALASASLFTQEAFVDDLRALEPGGMLVARRPAEELDRLRELALASLQDVPVAVPEDHLFACTHKGAVAVIISKAPLAAPEVKTLRRHCKANKFAEVLAPDAATDGKHRRRRQTSSPSRGGGASPPAAADGEGNDVDDSRPTDERPFSVEGVKSRGALALARRWRALAVDPAERAAFVATAAALALVLVAVLAAVVGLRVSAGPDERVPGSSARRLRALAALGATGAALAWLEMGLLRHMVRVLGHPAYALAFVLPLWSLSCALGTVATERFDRVSATTSIGIRGALASVVTLALAFGLAALIGPLTSQPLAIRVAACVVITAVAGVLAGALVPLGLRACKRASAETVGGLDWTALGWAAFLAGGVTATAVGTLIAAHVGFSAVLLAAGLALGFEAVVLPPTSACTPPVPRVENVTQAARE